MIAGLLARLGAGRFGRTALRIAALAAAVLLLLVACRRSGERLGRVAERLDASERRAAIARNAERHARDLTPVVEDIRAGGATTLRAIAAS